VPSAGAATRGVDILETELAEGDLYLLCSDGLNSMLSDLEIGKLLETGETPQRTPRRR